MRMWRGDSATFARSRSISCSRKAVRRRTSASSLPCGSRGSEAMRPPPYVAECSRKLTLHIRCGASRELPSTVRSANTRNHEGVGEIVTEPLRVWIDQDECTGDGLCVQYAPEVFEFDVDGLAYVKNSADE